MKNRLLTAAFTTALAAFCVMPVMANDGMGINADPDASNQWNPHKVICMEDVQFKEYINDEDKVVVTLPAGSIVETNNDVLRKGVDTGWSDAVVPYEDGGSGTAYYERSKVQNYAPKTQVEIQKSDTDKLHSVFIALPLNDNEKYNFTISEPEKLEMINCTDLEGDTFSIGISIHTEKDKDNNDIYPSGTIHFESTINGAKAHEFDFIICGGEGYYDVWPIEKALDFSDIKDLIDHTDERYLTDGSTVKVNVLKDGRVIDMNGFECVGIADDAMQMHDGTIIHDQPESK